MVTSIVQMHIVLLKFQNHHLADSANRKSLCVIHSKIK